MIRSAYGCNIGIKRLVNQDRVYATDREIGSLPNLYIVADGMGGHAAGEIAAQTTVDYCREFIRAAWPEPPETLFREMAASVNAQVYKISSFNPKYEGMGTTLVAVTVCPDAIYCLNVGDSRLYAVNSEGEFVRITVDHSVVEMMARRGEITQEEARVHPKRNFITRAIGTEATVRPDVYRIPIDYAELLLLCSDGLSGQVEDGRISEIIGIRGLSLQTRVEMLINEANRNGGADNVSVILIDTGRRRD